MNRIFQLILILSLALMSASGAAAQSEPDPQIRSGYPWKVQANANLNVRSGQGTDYEALGLIEKGTTFNALSQASEYWLEIEYGGMKAYVSSRYVTFLYQISEEEAFGISDKGSWDSSVGNGPGIGYYFRKLLSFLGKILRLLLIFGLVLLVITFKDFILAMIGTSISSGFLLGIVFLIFGGKFSTGFGWGAIIGVVIVGGTWIRSIDFSGLFTVAGGLVPKLLLLIYLIVSTPAYYLERIHRFLMKPWRFLLKDLRGTYTSRPVLRRVTACLQIPLYLVLTPLRAAIAFYYNIIVHATLEELGYLIEVLAPEDSKEGRGNILGWIMMLPYRVVKYPLYHGGLTIIESCLFTIFDILDPAGTVFHGTDDIASDSIASDPRRNQTRRLISNRFSGTFKSSDSTWAGNGVYFAPRRMVAYRYANDPYRCNGDPCIIVCRTTFGKTIDFGLSTYDVFYNTGYQKPHQKITRWCLDENHYVTGEWWNPGGGYWEYCMFDWQNRYNHPWRIRPLYVINLRRGFFQRIPGGMSHWLFSKDVLRDIFKAY